MFQQRNNNKRQRVTRSGSGPLRTNAARLNLVSLMPSLIAAAYGGGGGGNRNVLPRANQPRRSGGGSSWYSSLFRGGRRRITTGYLAGKYRKVRTKPLKLKAKRNMRKFDVMGTRVNWEEGLEYNDQKIVYVGHGLPVRRVFEQFTRSLYRSIMKTANHDFGNWYDAPVFPVTTAQPRFILYYDNDKGVHFNSSKGITSLSSHSTMWTQFDAWLFDTFIDNVAAGSGVWLNSMRIVKLVLQLGQDVSVPGFYVDSFELPLEGAMAKFNALQSLKVQNVSLSTDGSDLDSDINNVPINGRLYEAPGNALKFKFSGYRSLGTTESYSPTFVGMTSSIIRANSGTNVPTEPPEAYELANCKGYTKVSINPGKIKTSTISMQFSCNLDRFFTLCSTAIRGDGTLPDYNNQLHPFGRCRVMALEKVIGKIGGSETDMKVRLEVDTKLQCWVKTKKKIQLCPLNFNTY